MSLPIPANESERLKTLRRLDVLDTVAEKDFDDLTKLAAMICGVPISLVSLIDADRQWFKSKVGLEVSETPREMAFCAHTILDRKLFIVSDATIDSRFADNPLVTGAPDIRFYAGAPLITEEGIALGSLCVIDTVPRDLTNAQKEGLEMLANQVMKLLKVRLQNAELEKTNRLLETANRKLEETNLQLIMSEESYRVVAESASDVIITIDENNIILFANPAAQKVFGYAPPELIGEELGILIPERMREAHRRGMQRYMQHGNRNIPWNGIILPCIHKNGTEMQIEISFGEHETRGKRSFTAVMRDTSERERIKNDLKTSEERYRFLAESIPQQVWAARADGFINYGNGRTNEYFGPQMRDSLLGIQWHKIIHPDDLTRTEILWSNAVKTGENYENEYRLLKHDGEYRWHLSQAAAMRDAAGSILKWYGTNTDIHDRKIAESAMREAEGYRNLFQHANDAILLLDLETEVVLEANEKACELYGFEHSDFIGRSMRDLSQNIAHSEIFRRELKRAGDYQTFETTQYRTDGTPIELLINSSVIDYDNRKVILSINRDITERNRTDRLLTHNALHDALTKLPNRTLFIEHLRHTINLHARDLDGLYAVLFLDFDRFKVINDSLGHTEGDNLLIMFAERIKSAVRPADVVARLGGDEFTILLDEFADLTDAESIAARIHESLKKPFLLRENEVFLSASIGIAFGRADYHEPGTILRDADIAMYRAKSEGRSRTVVFNQEMHSAAIARLQLEGELRQGLERNEFSVYYQPIINLQTDRIKGFEALVRWLHPERGFVSPIEFIPLAEDTGLILPLGEFVLRDSCRQLTEWQQESSANSNLTISVNLSCKQFLQPDLVEMVAATLEETKLAADCLRLEVTESYLMDDTEAAIEIMHRLRELGIKLSLDDFGTGYSSLSYLHRLPLDYLKIDRSFISRMQPGSEEMEIVRTVIGLAKNLGMKTIAEGVETNEQAQQLKTLDCDHGQGFLYSKPIPATEINIPALNASIKSLQMVQPV